MPDPTLSAKRAVSQQALTLMRGHAIIGVGCGSTVQCLIEAIATAKLELTGIVAACTQAEAAIKAHHLPLLAFNAIDNLPIYFDGTDGYNSLNQLCKGRGGAMVREKVLAYASQRFICLIDDSKQPEILGTTPIPVEVLPMARSQVAREIVKLQGRPQLRPDYTTDNGNIILDVHGWHLEEPIAMETALNQIPGVVGHGLFARRGADEILIGHPST